MLTISSELLQSWVFGLLLPLVRVLGLVSTAPILNHSAIPKRIKLLIGGVIALIIMPTIPPVPTIDIFSFNGVLIIAKEVLIGLAMGFSMRLLFSAVELAGHLIAMTMGIGFATFFDPQTHGQSNAISQYLVVIVSLIFLTLDGHLLMISAMSQSFHSMPIANTEAIDFMAIVKMGQIIFQTGLILSMPLVTALLITNMALGILTKTAPQLNIFGIGFPITIFVGLLLMILTMPTLLAPVKALIEQSFTHMHSIIN